MLELIPDISLGERLVRAVAMFWPHVLFAIVLFGVSCWSRRSAYVTIPLGLLALYLQLDDYYEPTIYGAMGADLGYLATPVEWSVSLLYVVASVLGTLVHRRTKKTGVPAAAG